jgi:signal transduction histidine kinase
VRLPRPSIRLRLTAWYATIFIAMGTVLLVVSYAVVRHEFRDEQGKVHVAVEELTPVKSGAPTIRVKIAPGIPPENTNPVRELSAEARDVYRQARNAYAAQVSAANDRALSHVLLAFGGALLLVTLASVAAGWMVAGRALRPISRITATARSISDRTLDARIALRGPRDELRELADTFDSMLERLEAAFESQRRFVANASHELRTPLAIVRTELDVTLDDPRPTATSCARWPRRARRQRTHGAPDRLAAALASSEGGIVQTRRPTSPRSWPRHWLAREGAFGAGGALQLDATLDSAPVVGDPVLLERLAANLIENAVRYNAAVGWVRVRTGIERGEAVLHVVNPGARIDRSAVEELLWSPSAAWSRRARARPVATAWASQSSARSRRPTAAVSRVLGPARGRLEATVSLPMAAAAAGEPSRQRTRAGVGTAAGATAASIRAVHYAAFTHGGFTAPQAGFRVHDP